MGVTPVQIFPERGVGGCDPLFRYSYSVVEVQMVGHPTSLTIIAMNVTPCSDTVNQ